MDTNTEDPKPSEITGVSSTENPGVWSPSVEVVTKPEYPVVNPEDSVVATETNIKWEEPVEKPEDSNSEDSKIERSEDSKVEEPEDPKLEGRTVLEKLWRDMNTVITPGNVRILVNRLSVKKVIEYYRFTARIYGISNTRFCKDNGINGGNFSGFLRGLKSSPISFKSIRNLLVTKAMEEFMIMSLWRAGNVSSDSPVGGAPSNFPVGNSSENIVPQFYYTPPIVPIVPMHVVPYPVFWYPPPILYNCQY